MLKVGVCCNSLQVLFKGESVENENICAFVAVLMLISSVANAQTRKRIAIFRFDDRSAAAANMNIGQLVTDDLISKLADSGGFEIIDREYLQRIQSEQNLKLDERFSAEGAAHLGKLVHADVIIFGQIDSFNAKKRRLQEEQAAQERAAYEARVRDETNRQIAEVRPDLDDAISRLNAANIFWRNLNQQLSVSGRSLRSEIRAALSSANNTAQRCQQFVSQMSLAEVKICIPLLNRQLDALNLFK